MEQKNNYIVLLLKRISKWTPFRRSSLMGFTLIEVLITIVIIGIIASLAYPRYTKTIEKTRISEAEVNLRLIRAAERMYKMQFAEYADTIGELNLGLPISASSGYWFYYSLSSSDNFAADFTSMATRKAPAPSNYAGKTITITDEGNWGGTYPAAMIPSD